MAELFRSVNIIYPDSSHSSHTFQVPPVTKVAYGERASLKWEPSLVFGPNAVGAGTPMTATETMHIEAHKGQLFASFGKWMSPEFVKKQGHLAALAADFS